MPRGVKKKTSLKSNIEAQIKVGNMPMYTNKTGIRRALGITAHRFLDLKSFGLPEYRDGIFCVPDVITWYKQETRVGLARGSLVERNASERLAVAKAEKEERTNLIEKGQLVPLEDIKAVFEAQSVIVANAFESLGARLCHQLASMDDPAEIQALVFNESREARRLIADKFDGIKIEDD